MPTSNVKDERCQQRFRMVCLPYFRQRLRKSSDDYRLPAILRSAWATGSSPTTS